ncbi:hypothetical protein, partial [Mesorhizobium sp.]|uniref:hypothetical protein n=1 Tax=Mesorhizobium sp. TaxID=1871066 RepID=UPI0025C17F09
RPRPDQTRRKVCSGFAKRHAFKTMIETEKAGRNPAFSNRLDSSSVLVFPASAGQGRTPMIRAPMNANAAQIINALIGLVSPMP